MSDTNPSIPEIAQSALPQQSELLELQRQLQTLRLDFEKIELLFKAAEHDLAVQRTQSNDLIQESVQRNLAQLFGKVAAPVAMLATQSNLLSAQGKEVQAKDVMAVANRLVGALAECGLEITETIGTQVKFDKALHEVTGDNQDVADGDPVVVKMVGVSFCGTVLRPAIVSRIV